MVIQVSSHTPIGYPFDFPCPVSECPSSPQGRTDVFFPQRVKWTWGTNDLKALAFSSLSGSFEVCSIVGKCEREVNRSFPVY